MSRRFGLALAFALLASTAWAQTVSYPDPQDTVPGAGNVTYLDLVRLFVPDIAAVGTHYQGHTLSGIRHIGGEEDAASPPDPVDLGQMSSIELKGKRLLLLADLGQSEDSVEGLVPLALYDISGKPKLLDAMDIALDRFTGLEEPPVLDLGSGSLLALTRSSHFNSSQNYVSNALALVRGDRITAIDTVFTFNDQGCAFERRQVPTFDAVPGKADSLSDIRVTVTETTTLSGEDCGDDPTIKAGKRVITATYRWDAKAERYVPDSDALERLATENAERF